MSRPERYPRVPEEGPISVGTYIRVARWSQGITIPELASLVGTSRGHVSHIETGSDPASKALLDKISNALGYSLEDLVSMPRESLKEIVSKGPGGILAASENIPISQQIADIRSELQSIREQQNQIISNSSKKNSREFGNLPFNQIF